MVVMKHAVRALFRYFLGIFIGCGFAHAKQQDAVNCARHQHAKLLVSHVRQMGELKGVFAKKNKKKPISSVTKEIKETSQKTQTEAYLSVPSCASLVDSTWREEKIRFKPIIDTVMQREREHNDDYYVFYHGQMREFCVMHDFLKELYQLLHIHELFDEFAFLRAWQDGSSDLSVTPLDSFIDGYEKARKEQEEVGYYFSRSHPDWDDEESSLRPLLLSVNLSLFGNTGSKGSCTFDFFVHSWNIAFSGISPILESILKKFGIKRTYVSRLTNVASLLKSSEGALMQIFIPKRLVDDSVYLSHILGTPYRNPIAVESFDVAKGRHSNMSSILEMYKKHPELIREINKIQARIVLYPQGMLNPDSGIKIFRYTTVSEQNMALYNKQIKDIAEEIAADMLAEKLVDAKKVSANVAVKKITKKLQGSMANKFIRIVSQATQRLFSKPIKKSQENELHVYDETPISVLAKSIKQEHLS